MIEALKQAVKIFTLPARLKLSSTQALEGEDCPYIAEDGKSENIRALSFK